MNLETLGWISAVSAQSSDATCTLGSFRWAFNSHDQSPCVVASSLFGICTGNSYNLEPLQESSHYLGPSFDTANGCQCNTVSYSMISACGLCQNRTIALWSEWSAACATVSIRTFPSPLPSGLAVPGWAYLDVKEHDIFDVNLAKQNANLTESTMMPQPTTTTMSSASSPTSPSTAVISESQAAADAAAADERLRNIIGSSIVGGLVFLIVVAAALLTFYHYRQRARAKGLPNSNDEEAIQSVSDEKSENESQTSKAPVPILLLHPPTSAALPSPSFTTSSEGSDGSLSPTRATHPV